MSALAGQKRKESSRVYLSHPNTVRSAAARGTGVGRAGKVSLTGNGETGFFVTWKTSRPLAVKGGTVQTVNNSQKHRSGRILCQIKKLK
tara:strand:+ start:4458 stop:4724 length:267 start_codon:yes stop_codon:yes gene_type:complete